jgi:CPA1 family monovalent cation:H+ antiporter
MDPAACQHAPATIASPSGNVCDECGSTVNLRLCAACGHVGCCESQAGHGRSHALGANHPVILQMPAGSGFMWCYTESRYV